MAASDGRTLPDSQREPVGRDSRSTPEKLEAARERMERLQRRIAEMREEGLVTHEIAAALGLSSKQVYYASRHLDEVRWSANARARRKAGR